MENNSNKKKKILVPLIISLCCIALIVFFGLKFTESNKGGKSTTKLDAEQKKSEYRMSGNSLENFDLYFLKLENEKVNKIYSPLSIKYALVMLNEGAADNSKEQISAVVGDYKGNKYVNSNNLSLANAMFIKNSIKDSIKSEYTSLLQNKYNASVIFDSFESPDTINKWVKEKTLNLLDNLVDDVSDLDFALVNALAIDMEWEERFFDNERQLDHDTAAGYMHERRADTTYHYSWFPIFELEKSTFEDVDDEISGMRIKGSFNKYDIISELGVDKIKETVRTEYKKHLDELTEEDWDYSIYFENGKTEEIINELVNSYDYDQYIEEIGKNYKDVAYNTDFSFYVDDSVKVFAKDLKEYDGTTLQYVGIMPTKVALDSYISSINADKVNTLISNLKELKLESFKDGVVTEINGYIPKFNFEYSLDLKQSLEKLGITDVFDSAKANLSGISSVSGLYVPVAKHKANIEFTQYGIKAAAATMVGGMGAGGAWDYLFEVPFEEIDLTFDKPYMFVIRNKDTGEVWFAGTVYNPLLWSEDKTRESFN